MLMCLPPASIVVSVEASCVPGYSEGKKPQHRFDFTSRPPRLLLLKWLRGQCIYFKPTHSVASGGMVLQLKTAETVSPPLHAYILTHINTHTRTL
jgi:hypothetical protein